MSCSRLLMVLVATSLLSPVALAEESDPAYDPAYDAGADTAAAAVAEAPEGPRTYTDWDGRYVGLIAGFGTGLFSVSDPVGLSANDKTMTGLSGGAVMGSNWQFTNIMLGTETDISLSRLGGDFNIPGAIWGCQTNSDGCNTQLPWLATTRLRAGVTLDNFMPYVTGGLALGGVNTDYGNAILVKDTKGVALGWTVGGGLEVALNDHFTIKAEALYVDLGHVWSALSASDFKVDTRFATVRAGVNFKF